MFWINVLAHTLSKIIIGYFIICKCGTASLVGKQMRSDVHQAQMLRKVRRKKKCRATSFLAPSIVCKKQRKLNIKGKDVFVEFYLGGDYKVILATINSWSRSLMSVFQKLKYNNLTIYFIVIYFSKYSTALHFLFSSFYWYWEWKELHQITHMARNLVQYGWQACALNRLFIIQYGVFYIDFYRKYVKHSIFGCL